MKKKKNDEQNRQGQNDQAETDEKDQNADEQIRSDRLVTGGLANVPVVTKSDQTRNARSNEYSTGVSDVRRIVTAARTRQRTRINPAGARRR